MSWRHYQVLTATPDFTEPVASGMLDERTLVDISNAPAFFAWPDATDRILTFTFQTFSHAEWRTLREFFDFHGGRAKAFYLPTWARDFDLAANAAAGASEILVAGHWHTTNVTENRPDTTGRRLFLVNQTGAYQAIWIDAMTAVGDNDRLTLAEPLVNALEANRTTVGFCHLARLADDAIESEHSSPDHARASLTFRTVSHRRYLDQQEAAPGEVVGTMKPAEDIIATDTDPLFTNSRRSEAIGPYFVGAPQTEPYTSEWHAELDPATNLVTLHGPFGGSASGRYTAPGPALQIALTFDASGNECLAWELDDTITVAWTTGTPQSLTFDGLSPVAFNTFALDAGASAGTATVAIFYLRRNDSTIYARIASEDFAVEHRYCPSPLAPIRLHQARIETPRMVLVGMDANHRLARWRSEPYPTAIPPDVVLTAATTMTGELIETRVPVVWQDSISPYAVTMAGELIFEAPPGPVAAAPATDTVAPYRPSFTGTYESIRRAAPPASDTALPSRQTATGAYTLVAKMTSQQDTVTTYRPTATGTYAP